MEQPVWKQSNEQRTAVTMQFLEREWPPNVIHNDTVLLKFIGIPLEGSVHIDETELMHFFFIGIKIWMISLHFIDAFGRTSIHSNNHVSFVSMHATILEHDRQKRPPHIYSKYGSHWKLSNCGQWTIAARKSTRALVTDLA